jgi:hypothetical protein
MIEGNVIKFGYGDILVGANSMFGGMNFDYIKPPKTIGESFRSDDPTIEVLKTINVSALSVMQMINNLKSVSIDNPTVKCGNFLLDFSNFDIGSLNVVKEKATEAVSIGLPLAC